MIPTHDEDPTDILRDILELVDWGKTVATSLNYVEPPVLAKVYEPLVELVKKTEPMPRPMPGAKWDNESAIDDLPIM